MVPQNYSVSHILQNIFLCVQQNKDIHKGLELHEGENFYFWVNYPFTNKGGSLKKWRFSHNVSQVSSSTFRTLHSG